MIRKEMLLPAVGDPRDARHRYFCHLKPVIFLFFLVSVPEVDRCVPGQDLFMCAFQKTIHQVVPEGAQPVRAKEVAIYMWGLLVIIP